MKKTRIAIIEDNPDNLSLMTYLLTQFGYETVSSVTGEDGVKLVEAQQPDLVLCDLRLPGINGYEVVKQLKAKENFKKTPMVAVTAYSMLGDRDTALAAGFDGYLSKPIDPETFVKQVEVFLTDEFRKGMK